MNTNSLIQTTVLALGLLPLVIGAACGAPPATEEEIRDLSVAFINAALDSPEEKDAADKLVAIGEQALPQLKRDLAMLESQAQKIGVPWAQVEAMAGRGHGVGAFTGHARWLLERAHQLRLLIQRIG